MELCRILEVGVAQHMLRFCLNDYVVSLPASIDQTTNDAGTEAILRAVKHRIKEACTCHVHPHMHM